MNTERGQEISERHQRIRALIDPGRGRGLEIGPLFDPIIARDEPNIDIAYVDVYPGDKLRAEYSTHPGVPVEKIVDPDFWLIEGDQTRTLPEAVQAASPFDWAVASHVVEHVPDLIGWLDEVAEVLADEGRLVLAIPDRRFCFDAIRAPTSIGEMLLARSNGDVTPSVRAVYDHYSQVIAHDLEMAWLGAPPNRNARIHDQEFVLEQVRRRETGEYVDCHVWLFTPASFVDQLMELERLNLVSFVVDELVPPMRGELEFYARLRRIPRSLSAEERAAYRLSGIREWTDRELDPVQGSAERPVLSLTDREIKLVEVKRKLVGGVRGGIDRFRSRPTP